jgi:uncharacterized membrane protein
MKLITTRTLFAAALATLLTACGGTEPDASAPPQMAAVMQAETVQAAGNAATMPQPDCAPEGCNGLRIINANAEAYRLDAMERKEREAAQGDGPRGGV